MTKVHETGQPGPDHRTGVICMTSEDLERGMLVLLKGGATDFPQGSQAVLHPETQVHALLWTGASAWASLCSSRCSQCHNVREHVSCPTL